MKSTFMGVSPLSWALIVFAFCIPLITRDPFILSLIIPGLIYSVACMAWNAVERTGQVSLGQASFMTIGGYTSALLTMKAELPIWPSMITGGLIAALIACLLGMVVLRLGGFYFCIVTLSFGEIIRVIAMNWTGVTNGAYGLIPPPPLVITIGGMDINFVTSKVPYYYIVLAFVLVSSLIFLRIDRSRLGRIFRGVSSNAVLSEHLGMYLLKYRVIAFTVAGFFTGVTGALYSHYLFIIEPRLFAMPESFMILIMCTVGGVGSPVAGPIIGALLLSGTGDYLTSIMKGGRPLVFGALVVVSIFLLPGGLVDIKKWVLRAIGWKAVSSPTETGPRELSQSSEGS
jgi:branched-chain amino acid transport system permease protein